MRARQFISKRPLISEDQDLFEINMSPSNLSKLAKNINAQAGIEFEMILPNIAVDDESETEPDYDQDERITSIDDVIDFFNDGDWNSSRAIRDLREELRGEFYEWIDDQVDQKWQFEGRDYLRDYIHNNELYDGSEEDLETQTENSWENRDDNYDSARDQYVEEFGDTGDDGDWLEDMGYRYASDISNNYDIEWPHWTSVGGDAELDIRSVADDFSEAIGRPVEWSSSYHGARRRPGAYVVEPDGSLEGDDSGDGGLEFVSPPLPLDELLSDMQKIRAWAKERGAYTNDSTGLHMNISVPDTSTAKLDYVKLALLLGDEHVLEQFGRAANSYASSALKKIRDIIKDDPNKADQVLKKMQGQMEALATKAIHTGETQKFTSINTKGNYVEFRSPGGDYLDKNWDKVVPTLLRTIVALDAAMDPKKYREEYQKKLYKLLDSSKERLASPNVNKLLSMYFTDDNEGGSKDVARQLARELLMKRKSEREAVKGERDFWWRVTMPLGSKVEVVARTEQAARERAATHWKLDLKTSDIARARVEVLRPADDTGSERWGLWITGLNKFATRGGEQLEFPSRQAANEWFQDEAISRPGIRQDVEVREIPTEGRVVAQRTKPEGNPTAGNTAQGNLKWYIKNMETNEILHRFYARDYHEAVRELSWWKEQNPGLDLKYGRDDDDEPAAAPTQSATGNLGSFSGEWKIVDANGREIHRFGGVGNVQADANRVALAWLRQNPGNMRDGVEVVPVMEQ